MASGDLLGKPDNMLRKKRGGEGGVGRGGEMEWNWCEVTYNGQQQVYFMLNKTYRACARN